MNYKTALCWFADSPLGQEIIINGARRGIGAKHRGLEKYRCASKTDIFQYLKANWASGYHSPRVCKLQLFRLHLETLRVLQAPEIS